MIYIVFAVSGALIGLLALWFPRRNMDVDSEVLARSQAWRLPFVGLLATAYFFAAITGVWTFLENLGSQAHIGFEDIGRILATTAILAAIGSIAAALEL